MIVVNRCWSLIVCFTWLLLACHEAEPAVTAFGSLKPSNPTFVREGDNITLKWNYTIDGSIGQAQFINATDDTTIAAKFGDGDPTVAVEYQERFKADISNTLARLTILTVQSSDSGGYKFTFTSTKVVTIFSEVELKVQTKRVRVGETSSEQPQEPNYEGDSDAQGISSGEENELDRLLDDEEENMSSDQEFVLHLDTSEGKEDDDEAGVAGTPVPPCAIPGPGPRQASTSAAPRPSGTATLGTLRYTTAGCYYGYFGREGLG